MQNKMDESVLSDMYETNGFKLFKVQNKVRKVPETLSQIFCINPVRM